MNACVKTDVVDISFDISSQEQIFIEAADKLATAIDRSRSSANFSTETADSLVKSVENIGIAELLLSMDNAVDSTPRVLFLIAEALAKADVDIAWRGLSALPAILALGDIIDLETLQKKAPALAFPLTSSDSPEAREWMLVLPEAIDDYCAWLWNPARDGLIGPMIKNNHFPQLKIAKSIGLLGFKNASVVRFTLPPNDSELGIIQLKKERIGLIYTQIFALFSGLLSGTMQRLVSEAYAYAKIRESFGKPIIQHQAVAIRLADITLKHDAIRLCILSAFKNGCYESVDRLPVIARYAGEFACHIARDAVQTAAANGYVEGLPFKRLFEQTRTLATLLGAVVGEE